MKLSKEQYNKDKIIERIQGFFNKKFIENMAKLTKFVQRTRKINGINFFSLCV